MLLSHSNIVKQRQNNHSHKDDRSPVEGRSVRVRCRWEAYEDNSQGQEDQGKSVDENASFAKVPTRRRNAFLRRRESICKSACN